MIHFNLCSTCSCIFHYMRYWFHGMICGNLRSYQFAQGSEFELTSAAANSWHARLMLDWGVIGSQTEWWNWFTSSDYIPFGCKFMISVLSSGNFLQHLDSNKFSWSIISPKSPPWCLSLLFHPVPPRAAVSSIRMPCVHQVLWRSCTSVLKDVLSCPVMSCCLLPCFVWFCAIMDCPVMFCTIISCLVMSYPILVYHVLSCPAPSGPVLSCHFCPSCHTCLW